MAANTELFDGKYTVADTKLRAGEEAYAAEARAEQAHRNAISAKWALRIAAGALLLSFGAMVVAVVALSESHIHAPAKQ
ncbi:MAG TPA: hypothetical protein VJ806_05945 [Luteimonas sp.]|nr:hypothetical protein [Luteimonas sp.]